MSESPFQAGAVREVAVAVKDGVREPLGYEQITGLSAVKALTPKPGARWALLQAETQDIRWRDDGTDPTSSVGMLLKAGQNPTPFFGDLTKLSFLEVTASAKLNVVYYA